MQKKLRYIFITSLLGFLFFLPCIAIAADYTWAPQGEVQYFEKDGLIGLMHINGNILIAPCFTKVGPFQYDTALVYQDNLIGMIDKQGKILVEPQNWIDIEMYPGSVYYFGGAKKEQAVFLFREPNGKWGYVSREGKKITEAQWDRGYSFLNGFAIVEKDEKKNVIDASGQLLFGEWWDDIIRLPDNSSLLYVKEHGKWGVITVKGDVIFPCEWDALTKIDDRFFLVKQDGKYGMIDQSGAIVIPIEWDRFSPSRQTIDALMPAAKDEKYGYINKSGEVILPLRWDEAGVFQNGLAHVRIGKMEGFINTAGEYVIPLQQRWFTSYLESRGYILHETSKYWGYMDAEGNELSRVNYGYHVENPQVLSFGLCAVENKRGKWGYMDTNGNIVIPFQWDWGSNFQYGLAIVTQKGKSGAITTTGEIVSDLFWDPMTDYSMYGEQLLSRVSLRNGREVVTGYINEFGEPVCGVKRPQVASSATMTN